MSTSGPYVEPIELPDGPAVQVPKGSGFVPVYNKRIPTNIQQGESWSFKRIAAQFRAVLIEKERESTEETLEETTAYHSEAAATAAMGQPQELSKEQRNPAGLNNPAESQETTFKYTIVGAFKDVIETTQVVATQRSIFPCVATALVELINLNGTIGSMTLEGTFRWFALTAGLYSGQCDFSGYADLVNPITVYTEQVSLRISLFMPLSVASEAELKAITAASPGFVNLIYDKEVK